MLVGAQRCARGFRRQPKREHASGGWELRRILNLRRLAVLALVASMRLVGLLSHERTRLDSGELKPFMFFFADLGDPTESHARWRACRARRAREKWAAPRRLKIEADAWPHQSAVGLLTHTALRLRDEH